MIGARVKLRTKMLAPPITAPNKAHQIGPANSRKIQFSNGTAPSPQPAAYTRYPSTVASAAPISAAPSSAI